MSGYGLRLLILFVLSLVAFLALALATGPAGAETTYIDGDWIITESTTLSEGTWQVNGSIVVTNGTLTLDRADLALRKSNWPSVLLVHSTASLDAVRSNISGDPRWGVCIHILNDSRLDNTTVRYLDTYQRNVGIYHERGDLLLDHCTLMSGRVCVWSQAQLTVRGCNITDFNSYGVSFTFDYYSDEPSTLLLEGTEFSNPEPDGTAIHIEGPRTYPYPCHAVVRDNTIHNVTIAMYVSYIQEVGSVLVEGNRATSVSNYGAYLYYVGRNLTLRENLWDVSTIVSGMGIYVSLGSVVGPSISNETVRGAQFGIYFQGWNQHYEVWDLDITGSEMAVYSSDLFLDLHRCYVRGNFGDFYLHSSGHIHLYDCDHTYRANFGSWGCEVAEVTKVNITSITWQEGTPIEEGVLALLNGTDVEVAWRNIGNPAPVLIPNWRQSLFYNDTIDGVRGRYVQEDEHGEVVFYTDPFAFKGVARMDLIVHDDFTPVLAVEAPVDGELFGVDEVVLQGNYTEYGAGLGTVRVRYDGGQWMEAENVANGTWRYKLTLIPEGLRTLHVNITDRPGNSMEVSVPNITIDLTPPRIDIYRPGRWVNDSPVQLVGQTEPGSKLYVLFAPVPVMPDGMFSSLITLRKGDNTVHIRAVDRVGHENVTTVIIGLDVLPPPLMVETPAEGCWTSADSVVVTGMTDEDAEVRVDGFFDEFRSGERFDVLVPVSEGTVVITVTAEDLAGNIATVTRTVHVDKTPPGLSILSPVAHCVTGRDRIIVSGRVHDEGPLTVRVGGLNAPLFGLEWSREVPLEEGTNTILVEAMDAAGHHVSKEAVVVLDTTPPNPEVSFRLGGVDLEEGTGPVLTREVFLEVKVLLHERCQVNVTGAAVTWESPGNTSFSLSLAHGRNEIAVRVTDVAGNVGPEHAMVVVSDTEPPPLSILEPAGDPHFTDETYLMVHGLAEAGCSVMVGDMPALVSANGSFSVLVHLVEGPNSLMIVATDGAGNRVVETIQVVVREAEEEKLSPMSTIAGGVLGLIAGLVAAAVVSWLVAQRRGRPEMLEEEAEEEEPPDEWEMLPGQPGGPQVGDLPPPMDLPDREE